MRERIMGQEFELSASRRIKLTVAEKCIFGEFSTCHLQTVFSEVYKRLGYQEASWSVALSNGGFLNRESRGEHVEIATPECVTLKDAVLQDKAAELIAFDLSKTLSDKFQGSLVFHKKNTDFGNVFSAKDPLTNLPGLNLCGDTRSCHENYSIEPEFGAKFERVKHTFHETVNPQALDKSILQLLLFLITRPILTGSGGITFFTRNYNLRSKVPGQDDMFYVVSPRALYVNLNISSSSTTDAYYRGVISWGREAQADETKCFRLHLICGDANMSEISAYLKLGTTKAVLEMIESGFLDPNLVPYNLNREASLFHAISQDLTCRAVPVRLINGRDYNAIEIQELFQKRFEAYIKGGSFPAEYWDLNECWRETLECLGRDDEKIYRSLDWKIKQRLIERYTKRKLTDLTRTKLLGVDLEYHNVDPGNGLYHILKQNGFVERLVQDAQIQEAVSLPPANTRARLRRQLMDIFEELCIKYLVNWTSINFHPLLRYGQFFDQKEAYLIQMSNPFDYDISQIDHPHSQDLIARLKKIQMMRRKPGKGARNAGAEESQKS